MKRQITAFLTAALILACTAACGNETAPIENSETESETSQEKQASASIKNVYGETDIPDIHFEGNAEGKARNVRNEKEMKGCLDSMVFETHTIGDYKISLVGYDVRTDKANFSGSIYAHRLEVEIEKGGKKIEGMSNYCIESLYAANTREEYRIFEDRIGSYIELYELDQPVLAMYFYFDSHKDSDVKQVVEFVQVGDNETNSGQVGICEAGTGVGNNPDGSTSDESTMLRINPEDGALCRISLCAADKFKVVDGKTLLDEDAKIKYTFSFADPPQFELYTAEKTEKQVEVLGQ